MTGWANLCKTAAAVDGGKNVWGRKFECAVEAEGGWIKIFGGGGGRGGNWLKVCGKGRQSLIPLKEKNKELKDKNQPKM